MPRNWRRTGRKLQASGSSQSLEKWELFPRGELRILGISRIAKRVFKTDYSHTCRSVGLEELIQDGCIESADVQQENMPDGPAKDSAGGNVRPCQAIRGGLQKALLEPGDRRSIVPRATPRVGVIPGPILEVHGDGHDAIVVSRYPSSDSVSLLRSVPLAKVRIPKQLRRRTAHKHREQRLIRLDILDEPLGVHGIEVEVGVGMI